jgi:CRP-like cAMP-binding protein
MGEKMRPCAPGHFPVDSLLNGLGKDVKIVLFRRNQRIFSRGDPSRLLFYIQHGSVKLTLTSLQGKEAVIAVLDGGSFLGHSALEFDRPARSHDAVALTDVGAMRIEPKAMLYRMHKEEHACAAILSSMIKFETQLVGKRQHPGHPGTAGAPGWFGAVCDRGANLGPSQRSATFGCAGSAGA